MKKITSLTFLLFLSVICFAQDFSKTTKEIFTTGDIVFNSKFTAKIDISSDGVTLTTITPDNVWFGIGFDADEMHSDGDVFRSNGTEITDAISLSHKTPTADEDAPFRKRGKQDWELVSNEVENGTRTMVVKRALKTNDRYDHEFKTSDTSIMLMWAVGDSPTYKEHSKGNFGTTVVGITLSNKDFSRKDFKIWPNPTSENFRVDLPSSIENAQIKVFNIIGKQIYNGFVNQYNTKINTSNWVDGVYLVQIETDNYTATKKLIKK